jgi:DNA polymerase I
MLGALPFSEVWAVDFEFAVKDGGRPDPVCLVAYELMSGKKLRLWKDQFGPFPPYSVGPNSLFLAYYSSAEIGCHLALGWARPSRVLDLFTEFRRHTNGVRPAGGSGLLGALSYFGLDGMDATEKDAMRDLILRGGPWSDEERGAILRYCERDVMALEKLLPAMLRHIDLPRALLRGRYMAAAAKMEFAGVPIALPLLNKLREEWSHIQEQLITEIDSDFHVYEDRTFKSDRFAQYLIEHDIPWPRLESGRLDLSDDTFREMAKAHPAVAPLRELRSALSELRLEKLAVESDGRNRCLLSAFQSLTGRNQPSNSKFIFGPSVWLRGLIKPEPGHGLAYIDFEQQEFGIASALAGDPAMMAAYRSGDPYLAFGKQAGVIPENATKRHPKREQFKQCALAVMYGMEAEGLAARIGQPTLMARELLRMFRETYKVFWKWSEETADHAELRGYIETVYGWRYRTSANTNRRRLKNFPMQANGAEMLRIACILGIERGVEIVAPVHDAILLHSPLERLDQDVAVMQQVMAEASRAVLAGFEIATEAKVVRYPDRYMDRRGEVMWRKVMRLIGEAGSGNCQPQLTVLSTAVGMT